MAHDIVGLSIGITVPFVILCVLSFLVRIYARRCVAKSLGKDDWAIILAFIAWIGQQIITYSWVYLGAGKHESEVPAHKIELIKRYLFAEEFHYLLTQLLIKQSFLLFYLRFLGTTRWRRAIYCTMALVCVQVAGTWIFYGLQCIPIQAYFHPERYPHAQCLNTGVAYYAPSAANVFVDLVIYVLPIKPLFSLQVSLARRIRMILVMTLGGCTILVSTLRFIVLYQLANNADFTYIFGRVVIVTTIEFVIAMVTANMPAISIAWQAHASNYSEARWDHEMGKLSTAPSGLGVTRRGSSRLALRKTGPGAIPISRNKASVSAGPKAFDIRPLSRSSSPTNSEIELVKSPHVVVTSQWEVSEENTTIQRGREFSRSPEPLRLRGDV